MNDRKPRKLTAEEAAERFKPPHRLYMAFANIKSSALELARAIKDECGDKTPADVKKFLETCAKT